MERDRHQNGSPRRLAGALEGDTRPTAGPVEASARVADCELRVRALSDELLQARRLARSHALERLRLEELAALRQSELERLGRINLLGEMAAGLAHEINQPLAALIYTLAGAVRRAQAGALNQAEMLGALQAATVHAHRSAAIVSRIRGMANQRALQRCALQINDVLADMAALCAIGAVGGGVALRCEPDARLPPVQADKVQIEQVLLNLIRNGVEAVRDAPLRRRVVVLRSAVLDENTIEVSVEDGGAGLPPERMARMFEPFYTSKLHGTGLGLAICRSIIEEHGGAVRAENRRRGGLRVSFTLKVADGA